MQRTIGSARIVAGGTLCAIALTVFASVGVSAAATTVSIFDDFETDAAQFDSWRSSPFVPLPPPTHLDGVLFYTPGAAGRGLGFEEGFLVDAYAFLEYELTPAGATTTAGFVDILLSAPLGPGRVELWGSPDGSSWSFLDQAVAGPAFAAFSLAIDAGDPAQFLSLRGFGRVIMDDLRIEVSYVPLPPGLLLLACALGALSPLRGRAG